MTRVNSDKTHSTYLQILTLGIIKWEWEITLKQALLQTSMMQ